jgi:hypothetical protein
MCCGGARLPCQRRHYCLGKEDGTDISIVCVCVRACACVCVLCVCVCIAWERRTAPTPASIRLTPKVSVFANLRGKL